MAARKRKPRDVRSIELEDGKWYRLGHFEFHECCDCALVHRVETKLERGVLWTRWIRDEDQTKQARKEAKQRGA